MADGQLKLFKGTQTQLNTINNGTNKKTSDGNLIVAKNDTSSTGNLYIDYDDETRIQLSDDRAYVEGTYTNGQLTFTKLNGDSKNVLTVDAALNATSENPIQNKVVTSTLNAHTNAINSHSETLAEHSETISTLQTDIDNVEKDISTRINPILTGLDTTIRTVAADEINSLIDAADNPDTIEDINSLVQYVNDNAGDIAALVAEVNEKAEYQEISREAYDALSTEEKMNGTIYLIYDENGYISSSVDIVGLQNRVSNLENNMPTTAADLAYSNASTGMIAANVQAAIDELYTNTQVALGDIERLLAQI